MKSPALLPVTNYERFNLAYLTTQNDSQLHKLFIGFNLSAMILRISSLILKLYFS